MTSNSLSVWDYVVFCVSMLMCAVAGVYFLWKDRKAKRKHDRLHQHHHEKQFDKTEPMLPDQQQYHHHHTAGNVKNYFNSKELYFIPSVLSIFASFLSAVALIGVPAEFYTTGALQIVSILTFIIACIITAVVYVPIYYHNKFKSVFEYVEVRFGSVTLRKFTAIGSALSAIAYGGVTAYVPCVAFTLVTGIPVWAAIVGASVITISYTVIGGLRAVVAVDTLQSVVMFAGVIATVVLGSAAVGGLGEAWNYAYENGRLEINDFRFDLHLTHSFWSLFFGSLVHFTVNIANNQATLQRSCGMNSLLKAQLAPVLSSIMAAALVALVGLSAMTAFTYYNKIIGCDPLASKAIPNANQIMPQFIQDVMAYPGFQGLYYSSLFSASISSMSTAYNSVSSLIWEDWLRPLVADRLTKKQSALAVKGISLAVAIAVLLVAIAAGSAGGTAVKIVVSFTGAFTGCVHAVYFCGAFLPFITSHSLIVGLCTALPITLAIVIAQVLMKLKPYPWLPMNTANCRLTTTDEAIGQFANFSLSSFGDLSVTNLTTAAPAAISAQLMPNGGFLNTLVTLSFHYIPLFSFLCCLVVALLISIVTILLLKCFPEVQWLRWLYLPTRYEINPRHLAFPRFSRKLALANQIADGSDSEVNDEVDDEESSSESSSEEEN